MLIVQKYGGSSLRTAADIKNTALRICQSYKKNNQLIVVVSAMGNTTNELTALAAQVSPRPAQRELDMLLTTGERISMALLSMALNDLDVPAISFTGSQSGVLTDDSFNNASIIDLKPIRVQESLKQGKVVVLAGFQGVSPKTKEITTLGRGGSDTTAIAMAGYFKADRCEILKDVDGVASADPKIIPTAKIITKMSYNELIEMTYWGAKFLHHRAAELASTLKVPVCVGPSARISSGTTIEGDLDMYESDKILSINSHSLVKRIEIESNELSKAIEKFQHTLIQNKLPLLQILHTEKKDNSFTFLVTGAKENLITLNSIFKPTAEDFSTVSATAMGLIASEKSIQLLQILIKNGITVYHIIPSPMTITFVVNSKDRDKAIRVLHG